MHNWDKSLRLLKKEEVENQQSSMDRKQDEEHLGFQESIAVQKSYLEIKLSVTLPKWILASSEIPTEDLIEHSMSQLGLTIGKRLSILMTESYKEHGMRTTNISDSVQLV